MHRCLSQFYLAIKRLASRYDILYLSVVKMKYRGVSSIGVVSKKTDIVIEGFPRSANTYMLNAFKVSQPHDLNIAHHLHATAQVTYAVKNRIPVILLIRRPIDCIASLMIRNPSISAREALEEYIRFYQTLEPVMKEVVVAVFEDVIHDSNDVIKRANRKYNASFEVRQPEIEDDEIFSLIDTQNQNNIDNIDRVRDSEHLVARPSKKRSEMKDGLISSFDQERVKGLLQDADRVFRRYTATPR